MFPSTFARRSRLSYGKEEMQKMKEEYGFESVKVSDKRIILYISLFNLDAERIMGKTQLKQEGNGRNITSLCG